MLGILTSGTVVANRYEIISHIGAGGMGSVYKALQVDLQRIVALKILHETYVGDQEFRLRFEREGRTLSELSNDHILQFYQFGFWEGCPYIAMEYLDGQDLRELLDQPPGLSWQRCVDICISICRAMQSAHELGIVHRDLKPNNIVLLDEPSPDFVKVVDFGLARALSVEGSGQHLTQTGALVGSVYYMSPEQCQGQKADARSDIYALGCILYESLVGAPPVEADNPVGILHQHVSAVPVPPSRRTSEKLPVGLDRICLRALAKEPEQRFQSMDDFREALSSLDPATVSTGGSSAFWYRTTVLTTILCCLFLLGLVFAVEAGYIDLAVATATVHKLSLKEMPGYRLQLADKWCKQGREERAIDLLSQEHEGQSLDSIACGVKLAELLERRNPQQATTLAKRAINGMGALLASRVVLASGKMKSTFDDLLARSLQLLQRQHQDFVFSGLHYHEEFRIWYRTHQVVAGAYRATDPSLNSSLNRIFREVDVQVDRVAQRSLLEFQLSQASAGADKFLLAGLQAKLSKLYLEDKPTRVKEGIALRDKAAAYYENIGSSHEVLSTLAETAGALGQLNEWEELAKVKQWCDRLLPGLTNNPRLSIRHDTPQACSRQNATSLLNLGLAIVEIDKKTAETYLRTSLKLSLECNKVAPFYSTYRELSLFYWRGGRQGEAIELLEQGKRRAAGEKVLLMNSDGGLDVKQCVIGCMFDTWLAEFALEQAKISEAEKRFALALKALASPDVREDDCLRGQKEVVTGACNAGLLECLLYQPARYGEVEAFCASVLLNTKSADCHERFRGKYWRALAVIGKTKQQAQLVGRELTGRLQSPGKEFEDSLLEAASGLRLRHALAEEQSLLNSITRMELVGNRGWVHLVLAISYLRTGKVELAERELQLADIKLLKKGVLTVFYYDIKAGLALAEHDPASAVGYLQQARADCHNLATCGVLDYFLRVQANCKDLDFSRQSFLRNCEFDLQRQPASLPPSLVLCIDILRAEGGKSNLEFAAQLEELYKKYQHPTATTCLLQRME